jgi:hypothetical protein
MKTTGKNNNAKKRTRCRTIRAKFFSEMPITCPTATATNDRALDSPAAAIVL